MRPCALALILAAGADAQQPAAFGSVVDTVQRHCVDCHGGDTTKGRLDLAQLGTADAVAWLSTLTRVRDRVLAGEMPPADAEPLPAAQREPLVAWIDATLREQVPKLPPTPGRVTIRRLSRAQWDQTVFDLFGVRVPHSARFPQDDLGYGFDNIGDALSFSTLHLEHYLAAAGAVAAEVFHGEQPGKPAVRRFEAEAMTLVGESGANLEGEVANLYTRAVLAQRVELPRDGAYRLRLSMGADQAGDEPAKCVLRLDGRELDTFEVPQRELATQELTAPLLGGPHRVELEFPNDYYEPKHPDPARRDRNLRIDWLEVVGPLDARVVPEQQRWLQAALPARGADKAKVRTVLRPLLLRVHRRPPGDDEVARFAKVADAALAAGEGLTVALRQCLQAALASPNFLFRVEPAPGGGRPGSVAPVPAHALATRLSYFLWGSAPDAELLELAGAGKLGDAAALRAQALRLLADPRSEWLARDFAAQWLELRALQDRTPDPARFPGFDDALRHALRRESELLFLTVLRERRDVRELLDADFTFVDARLAAHYGLPAPVGDGFQRVDLVGEQRERGGLLGHGAFHAVTSNPTRTSPVKRGKWILDNLLGQAPPPPPPGNDTLPGEAVVDSARSFRAELAAHRNKADCAGCHVRMDALGFALERYDVIGRHRLVDKDGPIDTTAKLPDGRLLDGLAALKRVLAADPAFVRTLAHKLFVYGVGRELAAIDRLRLDLAVQQLLAQGKVTVVDLVLLVVASDAFSLREVR